MGDEFTARIGASYTTRDRIDPAALARFQATLDNEPDPHIVPQGFHWCLGLPDTPTAHLAADGHPAHGGFRPPIGLPRRMWAGSDIEFISPLPPGADIERISTLASVTQKQGATGKLLFVEIDHETRANQATAIRERQTLVYREAAKTAAPLPPVLAPDLSAWPWHRSILPTAPLLFRYSALSFNAHRIHYDLPYATAQESYPGLVVHGPLMATLLLDLCARALGPNQLSHFRFRAASPAFAGQTLHLVGRPGETIELQALGSDGRVVLSATGRRVLF